MPENPEVQIISEQLNFLLSNKRIDDIIFFDNRHENLKHIINNTIIRVWNKGKTIFFELDNDVFIIHSLRLTGRWLTNINLDKIHNSFVIIFNKNTNNIFDLEYIVFNDVRRFGTFDICNKNIIIDKTNKLKNSFLGDNKITLCDFQECFKNKKKASLKTSLLNQERIVSGLGKYLVEEIIFDCNFNENIKCNELNEYDIINLFNSCKKIINLSYINGGMSMSDYVDVFGCKGNFQNYLKKYKIKNKK